MCATAHNGLEKLSIRLAELQRDGGLFGESECAAMQSHLDAARIASSNCTELINKMRIQPIEIPALFDEDDEDFLAMEPPDKIPEDEMFTYGDVLDSLTGLPGRSMAARAMQSAVSVGRPRFAALFCIDRLRYMSGRFGFEAGQQAIKSYAMYLRQRMPSDTMLFRWGGGCFVGLFDLSSSIGDAKGIAEQVAIQKSKLNFDSQQRSALLNLTSSTAVAGLGNARTSEDAIEEFYAFTSMHSRKQPD